MADLAEGETEDVNFNMDNEIKPEQNSHYWCARIFTDEYRDSSLYIYMYMYTNTDKQQLRLHAYVDDYR